MRRIQVFQDRLGGASFIVQTEAVRPSRDRRYEMCLIPAADSIRANRALHPPFSAKHLRTQRFARVGPAKTEPVQAVHAGHTVRQTERALKAAKRALPPCLLSKEHT